jgi:hypothetical protein
MLELLSSRECHQLHLLAGCSLVFGLHLHFNDKSPQLHPHHNLLQSISIVHAGRQEKTMPVPHQNRLEVPLKSPSELYPRRPLVSAFSFKPAKDHQISVLDLSNKTLLRVSNRRLH